MEKGRKRVWLCLLVIVLAAVAKGAVYYYGNKEMEKDSEGVLIRGAEVREYVI